MFVVITTVIIVILASHINPIGIFIRAAIVVIVVIVMLMLATIIAVVNNINSSMQPQHDNDKIAKNTSDK